MKKRLGCIIALCALSLSTITAGEKENEKPGKGKVILTTFANFHSGFGSTNDDRGFELERAYIGYQYKFKNGLELRSIVDFGQSKDVKDMNRIGFLKNAWVGWKRNGWSLYGGLIATTQFKVQEDFWGKRYVMKSFQDEYKFGSSADAGVSAAYRFNKFLSADAIVVNGEGYKKVQLKDGLQYGAGVTITPLEGFTIRAYGSYNESTDSSLEGIINAASFAGYKNKRFSLAAEYNYMWNSKNIKGNDLSGISAYGSFNAGKRVQLFARWDKLDSKHAWNIEKDGMAVMGGVELKYGAFKIAPNFRFWSPDENQQSNRYELFVNASFVL